MENSVVSFSHHQQHRRHGHQTPVHMMMKKNIMQQRKEQLQAEVSMQQKMLIHQQNIREVLQYLHDRKDCTPLEIPDFIPPEVKGLVLEIATVEDEIMRLENQIQHLKIEVTQDQEETTRRREHLMQLQKLNNASNADGGYFSLQQLISRSDADIVASNFRAPNNPADSDGDKIIGFDNKALHFISKAINVNYSLNDFGDKASNSPSLVTSSQKENKVLQKETCFQERVVMRRNNSILKPSSSPLRDPRFPTPRPKDRVNLSEFPHDLPRKSMKNIPTIVGRLVQSKDTSTTTNQGSQKMPPNKLSENILKCLILIYVRLMRTSKQLDLERPGPISSRSTVSSLSFRADATGNNQLLSTSLILQKEYSRQQDPYGIFNVEEAVPRDIGPYKNLVVFSSTSLDPKCVSNSTSIPLFQKLRGMLNSLQTVDLTSLSNQQKLAFWINMYNSCILHGYLQYGVPSSPAKLLSLMNKATLNIGSNIVNAQAIEHYILRKPSMEKEDEIVKVDKSGKESVIRELYGLESPNPNVIFALSCGTRSSPGVKIYTSEGVVTELEKSKLDYLQASISVTNTKKIALPELLTQNMAEFADDMESLLEWVCQQLPTSGSLRKSIVDCFRSGQQQQANSGARNVTSSSTIVINLPYEFDFQYLLAI